MQELPHRKSTLYYMGIHIRSWKGFKKDRRPPLPPVKSYVRLAGRKPTSSGQEMKAYVRWKISALVTKNATVGHPSNVIFKITLLSFVNKYHYMHFNRAWLPRFGLCYAVCLCVCNVSVLWINARNGSNIRVATDNNHSRVRRGSGSVHGKEDLSEEKWKFQPTSTNLRFLFREAV